MDPMKQIYLLLICQGFYLGSVCQRWTFPERITALIGSCLEIPCTYHPAGRSGASSPVWYLYDSWRYPEILNTKDSSSVKEEYKDRTSMVPGNDSCTLRIDPVKREGKYYPGITEDKKINSFKLHSKTINVDLTDRANIQLHKLTLMTEGEATIIQCTVVHTCRSSPPFLKWNKPGQAQNQSVEISEGSWREESNLTYIPSYVDDGTPVRCTATYLNRLRTERSGMLTINYAPKNVTVIVILNDELIEGSDVTLQCRSYSKLDVNEYDWYKGKNKTKLPDREWEITVRNVTRDMEPYSCAAINDVGRGESAPTEIPVLYPATEVHIIIKNEGEFTELICDFQSSRPVVTHYTWMKEGSILQRETGKTLTLYNKEESPGQYSCIAHNSAGNSSSAVILNNGETSNSLLPLILGSVAAGFLLLFLILIIYFCLRTKKKPYAPTSPINETSTRISFKNIMAGDDNDYGNIQSNHNAHLSSVRSQPSVNVNFEENHAIYSNSDVMQPTNEVEYSVISHGQYNRTRQTTSRARQEEIVEYATLKH
ncbi:B-cell receptor CD22-like [Phyllobates terribilis]|uniref:B-cell receptor CD22-like n=1 Tax=Phyllobates terribilis TaxID=111132 RepID=UPI003CCB293F